MFDDKDTKAIFQTPNQSFRIHQLPSHGHAIVAPCPFFPSCLESQEGHLGANLLDLEGLQWMDCFEETSWAETRVFFPIFRVSFTFSLMGFEIFMNQCPQGEALKRIHSRNCTWPCETIQSHALNHMRECYYKWVWTKWSLPMPGHYSLLPP